ncbi:MAG: cytochrome c oxidase subunit II [Hyphomonas sp.]|uniref:cytochrome c oxidase subunit II n=1 Tax=Hyphomonas sp. TaxID=87 RepID=UPI00352889F0
MRHFIAALGAALFAAPALAFEPVDGALGMQPAATRIAERIHHFHTFLLWIIIPISLFVLALLVWVIVRHNRRANPVPRKFSHNTLIEVLWTVIPALILVAVASQSFPNLYYQDVPPNLQNVQDTAKKLLADGKSAQYEAFVKEYNPDAAAKGYVNVKVQGNQWNWTYSYPDIQDDSGYPLEFVSNPLQTGMPSDSAEGPRNLAVDYPMVVPAGRYIRYYTAAADVIHSFAVPAFGIKTDAVPGRLNEGWFLVDQPGVYYGQCSELCGVNHAYMPIEVRVVPQAQFDRWAQLMLTGDYDAAAASVKTIAALDQSEVKFAAANH